MNAPNLTYRRARVAEHHRTMVERYGEHDPGAQLLASILARLDARIAEEGGAAPITLGQWRGAPPSTAASMREAPQRDLFGAQDQGESWA